MSFYLNFIGKMQSAINQIAQAWQPLTFAAQAPPAAAGPAWLPAPLPGQPPAQAPAPTPNT